jgi:hypothetical protein
MGHWKPSLGFMNPSGGKKNVVGKREKNTTPEVRWENLSDEIGKGEC